MFFNRKVFVPERRRPIKTIKTIDCLHHFGTIAYYPVPQNTLCAWIMKKTGHTHTRSHPWVLWVHCMQSPRMHKHIAHSANVWSIQDVHEMKIWSNARQNNVFRKRTLCICSIGFSVTLFLNASNENGLTQREKERGSDERDNCSRKCSLNTTNSRDALPQFSWTLMSKADIDAGFFVSLSTCLKFTEK